MVYIDCQLDRMWNYLGDKFLGMYVRDYSSLIHCDMKTHSNFQSEVVNCFLVPGCGYHVDGYQTCLHHLPP